MFKVRKCKENHKYYKSLFNFKNTDTIFNIRKHQTNDKVVKGLKLN